MTVNELITKLLKVEDKDLTVAFVIDESRISEDDSVHILDEVKSISEEDDNLVFIELF